VQADPTSPQVIEQAVRQAERLLAQEKYWDVIQTLEPHLEAAKGRLRARAQLTIAKAYLKNPNWVKRGEEELQKVVQTEPGNVEALLLLANIYKTGGLKARAVAMLKKVLEVKPDHLEAAHALAELGVSANERIPTPPGSFLKKLFKKN
jgi:tetratricopeptide (TPR) repeat protein